MMRSSEYRTSDPMGIEIPYKSEENCCWLIYVRIAIRRYKNENIFHLYSNRFGLYGVALSPRIDVATGKRICDELEIHQGRRCRRIRRTSEIQKDTLGIGDVENSWRHGGNLLPPNPAELIFAWLGRIWVW